MNRIIAVITMSLILTACAGGDPAAESSSVVNVTVEAKNESQANASATNQNQVKNTVKVRNKQQQSQSQSSSAASSSSSSNGNCGVNGGNGNGNGNTCGNKPSTDNYIAPTELAQLTPEPMVQLVPEQVLPEQKTPKLVKSVATQILELAANPKWNPTAHTNLLRLASGAERLEAMQKSLVPGDRDAALNIASNLCKYEVMRVSTQWHMIKGQHASIQEQQDQGTQFRADYQACARFGEDLTDSELASLDQTELKLPIDEDEQEAMALPAAPPADFNGDFYALRSGALDRIGNNMNIVHAKMQDYYQYPGYEAEYLRLNRLYSALSQQAYIWRNGQSVAEVRAQIDALNAKFRELNQ